MSTSEKFMKGEAGKQSAFGTPVTTTFKLPTMNDYADEQEEHEAQWDSGFWTPVTIVEKVADFATFQLKGAAFYEYLPVFLSAAWDDLAAGGVGPYTYNDDITPTAVGAPSPYTFLFGANEAIGGTGPAVRIQDSYCQSFALSFDMGNKAVQIDSSWFGLKVDDNSGAGFAFAGANLFATPAMIKGLQSTIGYQDAATTGGAFNSLTDFDCHILNWTFAADLGLRPKWAADQNGLTYCGVKHVQPAVTWAARVRTDSTTYAALAAKAKARTFQEVQLQLDGDASEQFVLNMTGRWLPDVVAHGRGDDEVVMNGTFRAETPYSQVTTPHYIGWTLATNVEHT